MGAALTMIALTGASAGFKAYGESQAQNYQAAVAERDAMVAKTQAAQTDTALREELNRTLARIGTIRASANVGLDSPTTQAIMDEQRRVSDRERRTRVENLNIQANAKRDEAAFRRSAANMALVGGGLDAVTGMAKIGFGSLKSPGSTSS
ncbi:hypothetical protein EZH22_30325 (plasmid) [Xanthobacter dioxanivorans]|uniref:Uncharacterized protein n=1 Tax=Xanthobacter dioxanivorans TaxID=2528964 RepID=A0A974SMT9_9HYPH|nr:hypothetical protein [Xanthobacter dioxanivorans]QRG10178.1 hypothetical protein EZH22_30325 [Xanthobacter dioxanivorans]